MTSPKLGEKSSGKQRDRNADRTSDRSRLEDSSDLNLSGSRYSNSHINRRLSSNYYGGDSHYNDYNDHNDYNDCGDGRMNDHYEGNRGILR